MCYAEEIDKHASPLQSAFAGGAAGAVTRAIAQPLDVLKIRFQLQTEPIKLGSKYSSMIQGLSSIVKEEGFFALWSGHIPAQLLSISYGVLQFSTFEKLTELCKTSDPNFYVEHKHWLNFTNGATAATVATIVSFPFDTIRTRLIAEQKTQKVYKGFLSAFSIIIKTEGSKALFKGLVPTLAQIAPHAGIQFAVYKLLTDNIFNRIKFFQRSTTFGVIESSLLANFLAGGIAGIVSKTAIYPFDMVKKRLQIQGFQQHRKGFGKQMYCNGLLDCIKLTINDEGFLALYKGYGPSVLKAILVSALHFAVYDEIKYFLLRL
ncbi:PREDICTED: mitochondrial thiamine pyrophosphate carrier-like [Papilio xuthus]|uniref:Mitochondrial thiamine pyrophosphate carrier-like n=1 Tax=Papilio xuthus TaxID=66420 RepID=A0AAJ6ZGI8_PAPXU|nr:PREDICTED: mitochondrial thiamine pyrophosphate carrier-like [Papilio xuthus]